jgi:acetyltransferase-like isoleucine patch superfamily enzyme
MNNKPVYFISPGSRVIIVEDGVERDLDPFVAIPGLTLSVFGANVLVRIEMPCCFTNTRIMIGRDKYPNNDAKVLIGRNCNLNGIMIRISFGHGQICQIGENTVMYGGSIVLDDVGNASIGRDCLFAAGLEIRGADGHTIYDMDTREVLNGAPQPIVIGNHCWIGLKATFLKGACIPSNSIVGMETMISKPFEEENTIIVGSPARVVKRRVGWNSVPPSYFKPHHIKPEHIVSK